MSSPGGLGDFGFLLSNRRESLTVPPLGVEIEGAPRGSPGVVRAAQEVRPLL